LPLPAAPTALFLAIEVALAVVVLFPPAFFMGGTIPVLGQAAIRGPGSSGAAAPWLYGLNTAGAAAGALAAGFYLPAALGFRAACLVAVAINLASPRRRSSSPPERPRRHCGPQRPRRASSPLRLPAAVGDRRLRPAS
jgi:hypothetical protein